MGGMSIELFKLDLSHLVRIGVKAYEQARGQGSDGDDLREYAARRIHDELARQLHAAGAADAPLEEQLRALLSSHLAMQRAGAEMPSVDEALQLFAGWYPQDRPRREVVAHLLDRLRPHFARLTQERDEARALAAAERRVADGLRIDAEADRQRAERAEGAYRNLEQGELRSLHEQRDDLRADVARLESDGERLHTRIAELEARAEPGAGVVERLRIVFNEACEDAHERGETGRPKQTAGIRAVISALAAMGEEVWPTATDMASAAAEADEPWVHTVSSMQVALDLCRSRLAPVLGALRVENAETVLVLRGAAKMLGVDPNDHPADIARALSVRVGQAERACSEHLATIAEQGRRTAEYEAAERRKAEVDAAAREVSVNIDAERYDDAAVALDALTAKFGESESEVVRLRTLLHFMRAPVVDSEVSDLQERVKELRAYADEKDMQYKACAARQVELDKRIAELEDAARKAVLRLGDGAVKDSNKIGDALWYLSQVVK